MPSSPFAHQAAHAAIAQGYRASIDMTATQGTVAVDGTKRNELYSMLREEVLTYLKQMEIRKETVLAMKKQLKEKKREILQTKQALDDLNEEKVG